MSIKVFYKVFFAGDNSLNELKMHWTMFKMIST